MTAFCVPTLTKIAGPTEAATDSRIPPQDLAPRWSRELPSSSLLKNRSALITCNNRKAC